MMCTYSPEQVALYVNGDLDAEERSAIEAHLERCQACTELKARLAADRTAVTAYAVAPAAVPGRPRSRRSAGRAWAPAVAVALVILGVALTTQVQAVTKGLIELFPFLAVQEMSRAELDAINQRAPVGEVFLPETYASIEDAEKVLGYQIGRPSKLPEGYSLHQVSVAFAHQPINSTVITSYQSADGQQLLAVHQSRSGQVTALTEEGSTREVKVKGQNAAVVESKWTQPEGERMRLSLYFQWQNQPMSLTAGLMTTAAPAFSDQDLIAIAESIR